jgi:intracellular multiplication protein IcmE
VKKIDPGAKKSALIVMSLVAFIVLILVVFLILAKNNINKKDSTASIPNVNNMQDVKKTDAQGDPTSNYTKMAIKSDTERANAALASGTSFVPEFAPAAEDKRPPQQTAPAGNQPKPYENITMGQPAQNNGMQQVDDSAEKLISERMKRLEQVSSALLNEGYAPVKMSGSWAPKDASVSPVSSVAQGASLQQPSNIIIKSGERVFVSIDTAINTDEPSPVIAMILSGNARGMTIFGQSRHNPDNTISVEFTRIALPSGKSAPISAFAIDPNTGRTAVEGNVDHKIFERFVLPALAAGFSKYGEIMARQAQTSSVAPLTGVTTITQNMTAQEVRNAAIGAGAGSISGAIGKSASEANPSVTTERNLGIEVIFMQELII